VGRRPLRPLADRRRLSLAFSLLSAILLITLVVINVASFEGTETEARF